MTAGDQILPGSELQSQTPLPDLVLAGHLQRRSDGNPSGHPRIHVVKDAFANPPDDLVRDLAPSADLGDGKGSTWYVISGTKWQPSADGRSSSTAKRDLRVGDGKTFWHPETGITQILDQDNNPVGAYRRTLSYVSSKKNQQPEAKKSSKKKRLGWSMVEIGVERDKGAEKQLVLCKLHRTKPKLPATSMEATSTGAEAPRVDQIRPISGGDDPMLVQAAEVDVNPAAGRCDISEANSDGQEGHAEAGEEGVASLDGAELGTLCRPRGENPNRARGLGRGNATTMKKALVDEPRSGLTVVMKFGGSSINSAERIKEMANLVLGFTARAGEIPVVVLSAMGDTATNILDAAEKAVHCGEQKVCEIVELADMKELHMRAIDELGLHIVRPAISDLLDQLEKNLEYVAVEKGLTPTAIWRLVSLGESMSTTIFSAYLNGRGEKSRKYGAHAFSVITTDNFSTMDILESTCPAVAKKLHGDWIDGPAIPVVPCFVREACKSGDITPLGSDLTAMIVGKALGSGEIQIWEDTDGVLTGDPNICTNAIPVHKLTFDEAIELAYSGHRSFHPQSMLFAIKGGLPIVTIKNTSNPEAPGTTITQTRDMSKTILSSIVLKSNILMLNIESTRLLSLCDFQAQVFSIFKGSGICVDREATTGGKISLTLHPSKLCGSKLTQREVHNVIEELEKVATVAWQHQSIISLVGNVQKSSFILEKAFNTLGSIDVNAQNVWQRSSKVLNVSLVIHANEAEQSVKALHSAFLEAGCFLSKVEGTVSEVLPEQQQQVLPEVPEVFQPQQVLAEVREGGSGAPGVLENETEGSHHSMTDDRDLEDLCRRLRADDDWQTSFCMRQQWADSDLDRPWDETEPQFFSSNDPASIGRDADGALNDFFNNIDVTNIEPVRVDARNALIKEASHIALADIRRLFSGEELMHEYDGDDNGGDQDRYLAGIPGMASSSSMTRPPCADKGDLPNKWEWASLLEYPTKEDVKTPTCWCEDECVVKRSKDRKKYWTEGRRFFVCPSYKHVKKHPNKVSRDRSPSPPPLCGYFSWIDDKMPKDVKDAQDLKCFKKQFQLERNRLLNEKYEAKEKQAEERRKRQMDRERKEAEAREADRARKLARARMARAEDEARDKKGKGPMFP